MSDLLKVTVLKTDRDSVAVSHIDSDGIYHGRVVRASSLSDWHGTSAYITEDALQAGIYYGIDMNVLFHEPIVITQDELQQAFRRYGLWTDEDMLANRNKLVEAVVSMAKGIAIDVISKLHEIE